MTKKDKIYLLQFITLTGMFINPIDDKNIESFINGYELGTRKKCDYTQLSKKLLEEKYKIKYSSDGWTGQIRRLATKKSLSWVRVFKMTALEIIVKDENESLNGEQKKILKSRITSLIDRIHHTGNPWFNERWEEDWLSLCHIKCKWFERIWNKSEWIIVKAIDKNVQLDNIFYDKKNNIPTPQLIKLKEQFNDLNQKITLL